MKNIIITTCIILLSISTWAQGRGKWQGFEEFQTQKIAFITEKLQLSPEEAQQFWPHYNTFDKKRMELHKKKRELEKKIWEGFENYTDEESQNAYDELTMIHEENYKLLKEYRQKFLEVLPVKKALSLEYIEHSFRSKMIKEYRRKRQGQNSN